MKIKLFLLLVLREHRKVILRLSVIRAQEGKQMEELRRAKVAFLLFLTLVGARRLPVKWNLVSLEYFNLEM